MPPNAFIEFTTKGFLFTTSCTKSKQALLIKERVFLSMSLRESSLSGKIKRVGGGYNLLPFSSLIFFQFFIGS